MTAKVDRPGTGDLAALEAEAPAAPTHVGLAGPAPSPLLRPAYCGPQPGTTAAVIAAPTRSRKSLTVASATRCSSTRSSVRPTAPSGGR